MIPAGIDKVLGGQLLIDSAFALADKLRIEIGPRDSLKMCLHVGALANTRVPIPDSYSVSQIPNISECDEYDIVEWIRLLRRAGFANTGEENLYAEYGVERSLGIFFAAANGSKVGALGLSRLQECSSAKVCIINWVAVDPAHRGRKLGQLLLDAAVRAARDGEMDLICLATDDFRIAAIRTYCTSGFRACLSSWDRSHHRRWARIAKQLPQPLSICREPDHRMIFSMAGATASQLSAASQASGTT